MIYTQFVLFAMDADQESDATAVVIGVLLKRRKSKQRKKRSVWVKPWLQRRNKLGVYHTLLQELRMEAEEEYKQFLRMSPELFDELLILVKPEIEKETTILRDPIPSALKLAATIRYLSTGSNYADLQHLFRIHKSTLSKFIPEVCEAIFRRLKDNYLQVSSFFIFLIGVIRIVRTHQWGRGSRQSVRYL